MDTGLESREDRLAVAVDSVLADEFLTRAVTRAVMESVDDLIDPSDFESLMEVARQRERRLRAVEALADEWERQGYYLRLAGQGMVPSIPHDDVVRRIRAVIAQ